MTAKDVAKKVLKATAKGVDKSGDVAGTVTGDGGKSLFFIIMACVCVWLIMDVFYGADYIGQLVNKMFGIQNTGVTQSSSNGEVSHGALL